MLDVAVAAAEEIDERFLRQRFHRQLLGLRRHGIRQTRIVNERVSREADCAARGQQASAPVAEAIAIHRCGNGRVGQEVIRSHQIRCA